MAAGTGPTTAEYRAGQVARRLEQGWIGPEHVLVALFEEPGPASQALGELGISRELVEERARAHSRSEPPPPPYDPDQGISPNPAWYKLAGMARGLALAAGRRRPEPEHFLLAMVYGEYDIAPLLLWVGSSQEALLEALARRGVQVPAVDPPVYRPWRGDHRIDLTEAELKPVLDILAERHPPGSEWRWGFNWYPASPEEEGRPRRAWVDGEEGIDLDAVLALVRGRAGS